MRRSEIRLPVTDNECLYGGATNCTAPRTGRIRRMRFVTKQLYLLFTLVFLVQIYSPGFAQSSGAGDKQIPEVEQTRREVERTERIIDLSKRLIEGGQQTIELAKAVTNHTELLLKAADGYDVENYRKVDDELNDILEKQDANYLEMSMVAEALPKDKTYEELQAAIKVAPDAIRTSKMFFYKSSAVFYLCFGLPVQSSHYSRLALSIAEASGSRDSAIPSILFYSGAASLWSAEYAYAEEQLKKCLELDPSQRYAQYYLGDLYIAQGKTSKAIEYLKSARDRARDDELRGSLNRALALAYTINKQTSNARECIENARRELSGAYQKEFPSIVKESLGVVAVLAGDYRNAEADLTEALQGLQQSPLKLGNKLEAAQTALWRSYCRYKSGNKVGAEEDRQYAIGLSDEASHLWHLASILDPIFGFKESGRVPDHVPDRWAIVVGVGNFADPAVPKLRYPCKDARDMQLFLTEAAGFRKDHVKVLLDNEASKAAVVEMISGKWLPTVTRPGDLVMLFISSHGTPAYKDIGALNSVVTYDTKLDHLFSTSIPMQSIVRMLHSKLKKQHTFAVLDTCYAGGLGAPGTAAQNPSNVDPDLCVVSRRQLLVSSSDSGERSWESKRYQNSVFTRQFVNALEKNLQFDDFRKIFPLIAEKVNQEVTADFKHTQTPKLAGSWSGKGFANVGVRTAEAREMGSGK